ncbi:MAG: aminodeoxychorismate synthase component I [Methylophilaceae bacterium]|nr:aminodeoxychorismate synthase component I [Methylophilaceae bacterium]
MLKHEIPYQTNSAALFVKIADWPWAVFLDSGQPTSQFGRYDIMVANPFVRLVTNGEQTVITDADGERSSSSDPFELLKETLAPYQTTKTALPFEGGAIGYFAYDLARRVEHLQPVALDAENMPQMMVGVYDWAVVVDHQLQRSCLVSLCKNSQTEQDWPSLCALFDEPFKPIPSPDFEVTSALQSNIDFAQYSAAFNRVKQYIQEGDCYQVNLAQRFSAQAQGDAWLAYLALREISPAPYMSYMNMSDKQSALQVLSASPERFLQVHGKHVETRPIKGTRPRSGNVDQDASNAFDLQNSPKDRAENLMIVDLLRNDISKVCETGSVSADKLFALESFANVHHLVSTVTGRLAEDKTAIDLLRACFPGGSITGAPKLRSMEIIEELEPNRRGLYCGAIGYVGFDGNMDTNIAIRTAVYSHHEIRFYAGGGVVADSELAKEYRETLDKASSMISLIERFGGDTTLKAIKS